jgi:hypothetical protein
MNELVPDRPRDIHILIEAAFRLYRRYPFLFFSLAAGVIVTFDLIVLAATGAGPFSTGATSAPTQAIVGVVSYILVGPLISALHVHAVADVHEGKEPELRAVAARGLRALPVVAAAVIMSGLGIGLGFVALIVPGVILLLRWYVVAQVAAIDREGWLDALRGSRRLTKDNYLQVFLFGLVIGAIAGIPGTFLTLIFGDTQPDAARFALELAIHLFTASFAALATALFYFDLRARRAARDAGQEI